MKIIAVSKKHLQELIDSEINQHGHQCDLNHLDVSQITDMSCLFNKSQFNGNISNWNVSSVHNMSSMFAQSIFNGNISSWNIYNVEGMSHMFRDTLFDKDISMWSVLSLHKMHEIFTNSYVTIPYWAMIEDFFQRQQAIENYKLKTKLSISLPSDSSKTIKIKI